jgi:hypothetical protein
MEHRIKFLIGIALNMVLRWRYEATLRQAPDAAPAALTER